MNQTIIRKDISIDSKKKESLLITRRDFVAWRFGTGAQYKWKNNLDLSLAYELLWAGDLPMDVERGPLAGRVSGDYNDTYMHFIHLALNWRF